MLPKVQNTYNTLFPKFYIQNDDLTLYNFSQTLRKETMNCALEDIQLHRKLCTAGSEEWSNLPAGFFE